jgi:hypothetical protein
MKKMKVTCKEGYRIEDRNGIQYFGGGMDVDSLMETIDMLLVEYGLELYDGDSGSNDYLVAIQPRKKKKK